MVLLLKCHEQLSCPGDWMGPDCKNNIVFDMIYMPAQEWFLNESRRYDSHDELSMTHEMKSNLRHSLLQHLQFHQLPLPEKWLLNCVTYNKVDLDPTPYLTPSSSAVSPILINKHLFPELNFTLTSSQQCQELFPGASESTFLAELETWCPKNVAPFEVVLYGYGSQIHFTMKAINEGFRDDLPTYPRGVINIAEEEFDCGRNQLCYFQPYYWHGCTLLPADNQSWNRGMVEVGFWEVPPKFSLLGFFAYRATTVAYLHRPNPYMQQQIILTLARIGWDPTRERCIGVQIRRGDSCADVDEHRVCYDNAEYVDGAKRIRDLYHLHCMYISTDDGTAPPAIREAFKDEDAAFMANHSDLTLDELYSKFLWRPMKIYDQGNDRSDYDKDKTKLNEVHLLKSKLGFRLGTEMLIDIELLAACTVFVGTLSSNTMRLAVELHYARKGFIAPYISLDTSWCYNGFGAFNIPGREHPMPC